MHREFMVDVVSAIPASYIRQAQIATLQQFYNFRQPEMVNQFLRRYPDLIPLLFDTYVRIQLIFGSPTSVALEIVRDEESSEIDQLFAYVQTPAALPKATAQLRRFDELYWLSAVERARGQMMVDIELQ